VIAPCKQYSENFVPGKNPKIPPCVHNSLKKEFFVGVKQKIPPNKATQVDILRHWVPPFPPQILFSNDAPVVV